MVNIASAWACRQTKDTYTYVSKKRQRLIAVWHICSLPLVFSLLGLSSFFFLTATQPQICCIRLRNYSACRKTLGGWLVLSFRGSRPCVCVRVCVCVCVSVCCIVSCCCLEWRSECLFPQMSYYGESSEMCCEKNSSVLQCYSTVETDQCYHT